jgi:hypothetical protein
MSAINPFPLPAVSHILQKETHKNVFYLNTQNHVRIGYNKQARFNLILKRPNMFLPWGGGGGRKLSSFPSRERKKGRGGGGGGKGDGKDTFHSQETSAGEQRLI